VSSHKQAANLSTTISESIQAALSDKISHSEPAINRRAQTPALEMFSGTAGIPETFMILVTRLMAAMTSPTLQPNDMIEDRRYR
jgi:hypothetical protein